MRHGISRLGPFGKIAAGIGLALLGLATWWWLNQQRAVAPEAERPRHPDSYFNQLDAVRHNEAGEAEMRVQAVYAEHFENEPWIYLRDIVATGLALEAPGWQLTAQRGRMSDGGTRLEAHGDVVMTRQDKGRAPLRLETDSLRVDTDAQLATSDSVVVVSQGTSRVRGRGLRATLQDDRLRLEHDVEAYYEH